MTIAPASFKVYNVSGSLKKSEPKLNAHITENAYRRRESQADLSCLNKCLVAVQHLCRSNQIRLLTRTLSFTFLDIRHINTTFVSTFDAPSRIFNANDASMKEALSKRIDSSVAIAVVFSVGFIR